jgi:hypothetical protein
VDALAVARAVHDAAHRSDQPGIAVLALCSTKAPARSGHAQPPFPVSGQTGGPLLECRSADPGCGRLVTAAPRVVPAPVRVSPSWLKVPL